MTTNPASTSDLIAEAMHILAEPDEDERERRFTAWLDASGNKYLALRAVRRASLARAALYDEDAHRLSTLAAREKATAERMDGIAAELLRAERRVCGFADDQAYTADLEGGVKARIVLNPPAVKVLDRTAIPAGLWRTPVVKVPEPEPDLVAIKEVIAKGETVPGCEVVRGERFEWSEPRAKRA
jgi:hypothetical protein